MIELLFIIAALISIIEVIANKNSNVIKLLKAMVKQVKPFLEKYFVGFINEHKECIKKALYLLADFNFIFFIAIGSALCVLSHLKGNANLYCFIGFLYFIGSAYYFKAYYIFMAKSL